MREREACAFVHRRLGYRVLCGSDDGIPPSRQRGQHGSSAVRRRNRGHGSVSGSVATPNGSRSRVARPAARRRRLGLQRHRASSEQLTSTTVSEPPLATRPTSTRGSSTRTGRDTPGDRRRARSRSARCSRGSPAACAPPCTRAGRCRARSGPRRLVPERAQGARSRRRRRPRRRPGRRAGRRARARLAGDAERKARAAGEAAEVLDELELHLVVDDRVDEAVAKAVANAEDLVQPGSHGPRWFAVLPAK